MTDIAKNILKLKKDILVAQKNRGLPHSQVSVVAAAKTATVEQVLAAISAGVIDIGENRADEMIRKFNQIGDKAKWHFIGHLQRNKVRKIIGIADLIHSVDTIRLARAIDEESGKLGKIQDLLLEVNISKEESKFGFTPFEMMDSLFLLKELKNIRVLGLMTMAPLSAEPNISRPIFKELRRLLIEANNKSILPNKMAILSMGMTHDFKTAIEEGANMVRIGTGIFGQRGF